MSVYILKGLYEPAFRCLSEVLPEDELLETCKRDGAGALNRTSPGFPYNSYYDDKVEAIIDLGTLLYRDIESGAIAETTVIFNQVQKDEVRAVV